MKTFFGFAISDSMFAGDCDIHREVLTPEQAKAIVDSGVVPCINPSHVPTIEAAKSRFGIEVEVPEAPPKVSLTSGDSLVVMGVRGLPRLTDRHEFTAEEIAAATFSFSKFTVA